MRNEHGFTIIELLIAMAIGGIVMAAAYSMYISQQKAFQITEDVSALQQNLRSAMYFVERDMRMAGYNPTRTPGFYTGFTGITPSGSNLFTFTMDTNENGTIDAGETITYSWPNGDNTLQRNNQTIANNITNATFNFLNQSGATPANPSAATRVNVSLTASDGVNTRVLSAMIGCRNMGLK